MRSRELSFIGGTCTVILGMWMAFAIFMFGWDVSDLEMLVTPRKPPPSPAFVMRGSFSELPADASGTAAR